MHPYQSDVLARGQIDRLHREAVLHRLATSANGRGGKERPGAALRRAPSRTRRSSAEQPCVEG
jgi:hypothetical protein